MSPEYPYQIVTFIDTQPAIGEGVYQGANGWYPQLTLKRRFKVDNTTDAQLIQQLDEFFAKQTPFSITTGELTLPDTMPVKVLPVVHNEALMSLHLKLIEHLGQTMHSRFPERDGEQYYPHVTAQYAGKFVIDTNRYKNKTFTLVQACLIKDRPDGDSEVIAYFQLRQPD